jgi:hypothetical protein
LNPLSNAVFTETGRRGRGAEISQVIFLQPFFPRRAVVEKWRGEVNVIAGENMIAKGRRLFNCGVAKVPTYCESELLAVARKEDQGRSLFVVVVMCERESNSSAGRVLTRFGGQ